MANSFAVYEGANYPPEGEVLDGVVYGDDINVLTGILQVEAGSPVFPGESQVLLGTRYGNEGILQFTGNYRGPTEDTVQSGVLYGPLDTLVGTYDPLGVIPNVTDVRAGVSVGTGLTGVLVSPSESDVKLGVGYGAYGTEYVGQWSGGSGDPGDVEWIG